MNKRRRLVEWGKSIAIVLLLISAALLIKETKLFAPASSKLSGATSSQSEQTGTNGLTAAGSAEYFKPEMIIISCAEGQKRAVGFDGNEIAAVFQSFSASLGEALGSADTPQPISESEWRACLKGVSLTFDFGTPQPLQLLSSWLGTDFGDEAGFRARLLSISCDGSAAALLFQNFEDGVFYKCTTVLSSTDVSEKMSTYTRGNAFFAFENEKFAGISPYTVIVDELPEMRIMNSASSIGAGFDPAALLKSLDVNSNFVKRYEESDGTQVYVENGKTLRLRADGTVTFKNAAAVQAETSDLIGAISASAKLVFDSLAGSCGRASLRLADISESDGEYTVSFEYCIDGISVRLPGDGYAASVTISGDTIKQISMLPRSYAESGETGNLLPMQQTCAIVASKGGGEPRLVYHDDGMRAECLWVIG